MKKNFFAALLTICVAMPCGVTAFANDTEVSQDGIVFDREMSFYDEELDANVICVVVENGIQRNLTQEEFAQISATTPITESNEEFAQISATTPIIDSNFNEGLDGPLRASYREYYTFTPDNSSYNYIGSPVKVSRDLVGPAGGGSISDTYSTTVSETFSTGVTSEAIKQVIRLNCGFSWTKSKTASDTYTVHLLPGERGYVQFWPYYDAIRGTLKKYSNWDGLLSSKRETGYSVKTLSNGSADGCFTFMYS